MQMHICEYILMYFPQSLYEIKLVCTALPALEINAKRSFLPIKISKKKERKSKLWKALENIFFGVKSPQEDDKLDTS